MQKEEAEALIFAGIVGFFGAIVGLGKLLQSGEKITFRLAMGRSIVTSCLCMSAFALLVWIPDVPKVALLGVAAVLASLGESALERIIYSRLHSKK